MPSVPADYELPDDETPFPILWITGPIEFELPDTSVPILEEVFGGGNSRKLKSWGHGGDVPGLHWLATRNGTALHRDTTFTRFTHHLILRNDGFRIRGLVDDDGALPMLVPGMMYCIDTHSPHQVVIDGRFGNYRPHYKVQLVVDRDEPLTIEEAFDILVPAASDPIPTTNVPHTPPQANLRSSLRR